MNSTSNDILQAISPLIQGISTHVLTPLLTLLGLAAFVYFVWGVVVYMQNAGDSTKRKVGQDHMIFGILGLVIIFGANALVDMIKAIWTN